MSFSLLSTKLYFPPVRFSVVPRPRLVQQLKTGLRGPLTLISAPVGYGKTTLISEWYAGLSGDFPAAWLSLDIGDNDLARFLIYLTAALETIETGVVSNTASLLNAPQLPPLEAILTTLINDLGSFDKDIVLVLDDYQMITDPTIHEALSFLLDHCPPQLHLVLLTRVDPPFPLARLRVRNELIEIRVADLRFTASETEAFLVGVMHVNLSTADISALEERTEGWIAGLQLAALSIQGSDDIATFVAKFTGSHHYVVDYMVEEVLNRQPEAVGSFLLQTAVLERMNGSLCNSLTHRTDSQAMLERLERSNLFVIPLDSKRQWYRYHHFFADLLRNRLQHTQPEIVSDLHHRASAWYQENGYLPEALGHAVSGHHYEEAALIIENVGNSMLANGDWGQLLNWLQTLPDETIQARPKLAIFYIWGLVLSSQLEDVERRVRDIEQALSESDWEARENLNLRWQIRAVRSRAAYLSGDFHLAIEHASEALNSLDEQDVTTRGILGITLGSSYFLAGDLSEASRILAETQKVNQQAGNLIFVIDAAGSLAQIQEAQGNLHRAAETYQEIVRLSGKRIDPNLMAAYLNLGNVFYEWNDLDGAEQNFHTCLEIAQKIHALDGTLYATLGLAKTSQAKGDGEYAAELIWQAEQKLPNFSQSILGQHAASILAQIALACGDMQAVENWAAGRSLPTDDSLLTSLFLLKVEYLTLARLLILQDQAVEAELFLEKLYSTAESTGLSSCQIETLALIALARNQQGNASGAMQALAQALQRAEPEGYIRIFVDLGEPIIELLQQAADQSAQREYANKILSAMNTVDNNAPPTGHNLVELLSDRELEVVQLLVLGKSNKEIAKDLFLATGTIKKHLNNIYGKLGVNNRTECARRVHEMKLL